MEFEELYHTFDAWEWDTIINVIDARTRTDENMLAIDALDKYQYAIVLSFNTDYVLLKSRTAL